MFNYTNWKLEENVISLISKYGYEQRYFDPLFAGGFLRKKVAQLYNKVKSRKYDVLVLSRPDNIFLCEPPDYFFDSSDVIWHQRNNFLHVIYSTFIASNESNILNLCNWYNSEIMHQSISNPDNHNRYNNMLDHCGVLYSYIKMQNLIEDTYRGDGQKEGWRIFAEPYRALEDDIINMKPFTKDGYIWGLK